MDILLAALPKFLAANKSAQVVVLGTGKVSLEKQVAALDKTLKGQYKVRAGTEPARNLHASPWHRRPAIRGRHPHQRVSITLIPYTKRQPMHMACA